MESEASAELARVRALVLEHGWNAMAFQIVNHGFEHWFSARGDAVVGFVRSAGVRVVAAAPVCAEDRVAEVLDEWERDATSAGELVCYFGAAGRVHAIIGALPSHSVVVLGAQPVWRPIEWAGLVDSHRSLRAQLARARNKQVHVEEWPIDRSHQHPELRRCLEEWLDTRGLPPMHFLIEPQTLDRLAERRVFVGIDGFGLPVAFVVASPIPRRSGWLIEQFVRGHRACNGAIELVLDHAICTFAAERSEYVTMGLVPLSSQNWNPRAYNPTWLRWTMHAARQLGRQFYNFGGLEAFKAKFRPTDWEPIFAISNESTFSPRTMWAIASAFSGGSPITLTAAGAWKLTSRWLRERWSAK